MKNLKLTQILENALEGKNSFHKIINLRDEKIAKMIYSTLENIDAYYDKKYNTVAKEKQLTEDIVEHYYTDGTKLYNSTEQSIKHQKQLGELFREGQLPTKLKFLVRNAAERYMTVEENKKTYKVSFTKMPEEKVQKLESINAFFEKYIVRDEEQVEKDVKEL